MRHPPTPMSVVLRLTADICKHEIERREAAATPRLTQNPETLTTEIEHSELRRAGDRFRRD